MSYYLKATSSKNFTVEKGHQYLYHMDTNWLNTKANATIGTDTLTINPTNFWNTNFNINYSGNDIGTLYFNWRSHGVLNLVNEDGDCLKLILKHRGLFNYRYEAYTENDKSIITLYTKMNWFKTDYEVHVQDPNFDAFPIPVLVGILGFIANKIRQRNNGC